MIQQYIEIAERFSRMLQTNNIRMDIRCKSRFDETKLATALRDQEDLFEIRNELDAITKATAIKVHESGGDPSIIYKVTESAWRYNDRFQSVWFDAKTVLKAWLETDTKRTPRKKTREISHHAKAIVANIRKAKRQSRKYTQKDAIADYCGEHSTLHLPKSSLAKQVSIELKKRTRNGQ